MVDYHKGYVFCYGLTIYNGDESVVDCVGKGTEAVIEGGESTGKTTTVNSIRRRGCFNRQIWLKDNTPSHSVLIINSSCILTQPPIRWCLKD